MKKAVIISGPPGAGKGTQANFVASKFNLIHFDTGKYVERIVYKPDSRRRESKKDFDGGTLVDTRWILPILKNEVRKISKAGFGIVLSGSPRTLFEAFGDKENKGLVPLLVELYGRENILVFFIDIPPRTSISRNSKRRICEICGNGNLLGSSVRKCPVCGGKLLKRTLDKAKVIKVRLEEYKERTVPVFKELKRRGFKVVNIDGKESPANIFQKIRKHIK